MPLRIRMYGVQDPLGVLVLSPLSVGWAAGKVKGQSRGFFLSPPEAVGTRELGRGGKGSRNTLK